MSNNSDYLKELALSTSIHAIPSIVRSPRLSIKIFWIIFFIIASGFCSFFIFQSIEQYLNFEVTTRVRYIYEKPMIFPMITICNKNPLTTKYSEEIVEKVMKENNLTNFTNTEILERNHFFLRQFMTTLRVFSLSDNEKQKLGHRIQSMLILCRFGSVACSGSDFEWYFDFLFGNCYRFNSGIATVKEIESSNIEDGLQLILFLPNLNHERSLTSYHGLHLKINEHSYISTNDGVDLQTGTESTILVSKTKIKQIPQPYSNCTLDLNDKSRIFPFYETFKSLNKTYRQRDCINFCFQELLIRNCKCYFPSYYSFSYEIPCNSTSRFQCQSSNFKNKTNDLTYKECYMNCPLECETIDYALSISSSSAPTKSAYEYWLKNMPQVLDYSKNSSYEMMKDNFISIFINYKDLKYMSIEEIENFNYIDLISTIGNYLFLVKLNNDLLELQIKILYKRWYNRTLFG